MTATMLRQVVPATLLTALVAGCGLAEDAACTEAIEAYEASYEKYLASTVHDAHIASFEAGTAAQEADLAAREADLAARATDEVVAAAYDAWLATETGSQAAATAWATYEVRFVDSEAAWEVAHAAWEASNAAWEVAHAAREASNAASVSEDTLWREYVSLYGEYRDTC